MIKVTDINSILHFKYYCSTFIHFKYMTFQIRKQTRNMNLNSQVLKNILHAWSISNWHTQFVLNIKLNNTMNLVHFEQDPQFPQYH